MAATPTDDGQHQPPPAIPPSPTLTNPDMILPENEGERESQTPSPPFNLPSLSHLQAFYGYTNNNTLNLNNDNDNDNHMAGGASSIGVAYSLANTANTRTSKKNFSRHTGHRLSDIGEEDGPGPLPPPRSSSRTGRFPVSASSTGQDWRGMAGSPAMRGRTGEESGNNSTVNGTSQQSQQREGSDQKAVPGKVHSLHMGVNDMINHNADSRGVTPLAPVAEGSGPGDEFSSAILSSEAERILDNAKKRLTLMEGNLTRARSSMRSPSISASASPSPQPLGLGQPVGGLYRTISNSDRQASAALRPRPMYSTYQDAAGNRHSRVLSETNLPSGQNTSATEANGISRSVSAMGSTTLSRDERSFRYEPTRAYLTHRASTSSMQQYRRSPIANSNSSRSKQSTPTESPAGLGIVSGGDNQTKISNMEDFNSVYPADPPSRTQSQLQVRDLQDQMKGLHIKISSLKVKTQEDNLRRRSLQSLRTPSPLTDAESWYAHAMEYRDRRGHLSPNPTGSRLSSESAREAQSQKTPSSKSQSPRTDESEEPVTPDTSKQTDTSPQLSEQPSAESLYEDAEEGEFDDSDDTEIDREALNEILREPLDDDLDDPTLESFPAANAEATPHEEREDAFDYEHFILHSALGNFSHTKLRRASNISNSSVETTRPVHNRSTRHSRANSGASVSTEATFATAAEETDFNGVLYWDRKFNDELRGRHHYSENDEDLPDQEDIPDEETMGTPKATRRQPPGRSNGNLPTSTGSLEPPPARSDSATTGSATPTALASSLVSTVRAASSSPYSPTEPNSGLNNDDGRLLEQLFQSLGNVCMELQTIITGPDPDEKTVKVLRRRLDAARRVLDGELDA